MSDDLREHIAGLDIQEIRLVNGDHILAEVLWDHESPEMVIKDPIKLGIDKNGVRTFVEWFSFTDDQYFSIDKNMIMAAGTVDFNSKLFFCRLILTKNIKYNMAAGYPQDQEDLDLLKEIALMMGSTVSISSSEDISVDQEEYNTWMDEVDTSVIH